MLLPSFSFSLVFRSLTRACPGIDVCVYPSLNLLSFWIVGLMTLTRLGNSHLSSVQMFLFLLYLPPMNSVTSLLDCLILSTYLWCDAVSILFLSMLQCESFLLTYLEFTDSFVLFSPLVNQLNMFLISVIRFFNSSISIWIFCIAFHFFAEIIHLLIHFHILLWLL